MQNNNIRSEASLTTRMKVWWATVPLYVRCVFTICVTLMLYKYIFGLNYGKVCYNPVSILQNFQVYRIFTSPFFHGGLLHIVFNMLSLVGLGIPLEHNLGTVSMTLASLFLMVCSETISLLISLPFYIFASSIPKAVASMILGECAVGYSGVLFAYLVILVHNEGANQLRSVFGIFAVPAKFYPWVLLVVISLLFQSISWMGHLTGILAGYVFVFFVGKSELYRKITARVSDKVPNSISRMDCYKGGAGSAAAGSGSNNGGGLFSGLLPIFASSSSGSNATSSPVGARFTGGGVLGGGSSGSSGPHTSILLNPSTVVAVNSNSPNGQPQQSQQQADLYYPDVDYTYNNNNSSSSSGTAETEMMKKQQPRKQQTTMGGAESVAVAVPPYAVGTMVDLEEENSEQISTTATVTANNNNNNSRSSSNSNSDDDYYFVDRNQK